MIEASLRKTGSPSLPQRDLHVDMSGPIKGAIAQRRRTRRRHARPRATTDRARNKTRVDLPQLAKMDAQRLIQRQFQYTGV